MKTWLRARWLFDGRSPALDENGAVLIDGCRIGWVGRWADAPPAGSVEETVDLGDHTISPGLVDAHTHLALVPGLGDQARQMSASPAELMLRSVPNVRRDFLSGATTLRILGEREFNDIACRTAIDAGTIPGPHLVVAGRALKPTNGHGASPMAADGPDAIRRAVRENFKQGAEWVKLFVTGGISSRDTDPDYCGYSAEEIRAAVQEARRVGRGVAVHAHGGPGIRLCIEEGVQSIEHGAFASDEDLELMRNRGVWLVLTNTTLFHPEGVAKRDFAVPSIREKILRGRETVGKTVARVLRNGVRYALGTDGMHGHMPDEIVQMVEFGARPLDALLAATRNGAEAIGVAATRGTLEAGKLADIVSFAGNPADDVTCVRRRGCLYKAGERYDALSPV